MSESSLTMGKDATLAHANPNMVSQETSRVVGHGELSGRMLDLRLKCPKAADQIRQHRVLVEALVKPRIPGIYS
jgi:hypothetical protein